jgi:hypothetical protein
MHPRWHAAVGAGTLLTLTACFPPLSLAPIASTYERTGATPVPLASTPFRSPSTPPAVAASASPAADPASYFPARAGTWRYRVTTKTPSGEAIAGERSFVVSDVVTAVGSTTAKSTSTVKLGIPGFTGLDEADAVTELTLTPTKFTEAAAAGRTSTIPLPVVAGMTWTENGLVGKVVATDETLKIDALGDRVFTDVWHLEYAPEGTPTLPAAIMWLAPGAGPVQRVDYFEHEGGRHESGAELVDYPGK